MPNVQSAGRAAARGRVPYIQITGGDPSRKLDEGRGERNCRRCISPTVSPGRFSKINRASRAFCILAVRGVPLENPSAPCGITSVCLRLSVRRLVKRLVQVARRMTEFPARTLVRKTESNAGTTLAERTRSKVQPRRWRREEVAYVKGKKKKLIQRRSKRAEEIGAGRLETLREIGCTH